MLYSRKVSSSPHDPIMARSVVYQFVYLEFRGTSKTMREKMYRHLDCFSIKRYEAYTRAPTTKNDLLGSALICTSLCIYCGADSDNARIIFPTFGINKKYRLVVRIFYKTIMTVVVHTGVLAMGIKPQTSLLSD